MIENKKYYMVPKNLLTTMIGWTIFGCCIIFLINIWRMPSEFIKGIMPRLEIIDVGYKENIERINKDNLRILTEIKRLDETIMPSAFRGRKTNER